MKLLAEKLASKGEEGQLDFEDFDKVIPLMTYGLNN
jgi:hypothetical protein